MTSQERVNRAFAHRDQDRIPRHETFWRDTIRRWQDEGLNGDQQTVLDLLESDFHQTCWLWPKSFPGEEVVVSLEKETRVVRDGCGKLLRYWRDRMGTPEHLGFECDTRQAWEGRFKPALLDSGLQVDPEHIRRNFRAGRRNGRWCYLAAVEGFEGLRSFMGDEITLMAMADDPDWVQDVSRTFTDQVMRNLDAIMATGIQPDGLWIYGDMAFRSATICSPSMYEALVWPDHRRLADWAHAHNMKLIYHTDGNVNGVIDLYLKAGFDCLQPLECKAGMDIRQLCPRYGRELVFCGNVDVMSMVDNDRAKIEAEIIGKLRAGKETRGYIYHSDHSIPPQVSWKTYQWIIDCVGRHGNY